MAGRVVTFARTNPVAERILVHEPELIGNLITTGQVVRYSDRVVDLIAAAARRDDGRRCHPCERSTPHRELIVRLCGSLILAPTGGDAKQLISHVLGPVLEPNPSAPVSSR